MAEEEKQERRRVVLAKKRNTAEFRTKIDITRVKFDDAAKQIYLDVLAETGRKMQAVKACGFNRKTIMHHANIDPEFCEAEHEAIMLYREKVHAHAMKLALEGIQKPIFGGRNKDQLVGHETNYPISLIQMELRRFFPEYRETQNNLNVTMQTGVLVAPAETTPDEWVKMQEAVNVAKEKPE